MRTSGVDPQLQKVIRAHFAKSDWQELATALGITLKSVQYQLNAELGRDVTYHFIGLLAIKRPTDWADIDVKFYGEQAEENPYLLHGAELERVEALRRMR